MAKPLKYLKKTFLALRPTSEEGFEGFLRVILTSLTGIPFRLASSGLQGGIDGDSALRSEPVCFEAKLYAGKIGRNEVLTKIVDLARQAEASDRLWVLGATTEISAQLAQAVNETGDLHAISTLILDWTSEPLPLLAVAAVAANEQAIDFLSHHCDPKPDSKELSKAFKWVSSHSSFESLLARLRSNLNVSALATARSFELNKKWRTEAFSSKNIARERFGQALAVNEGSIFPSFRATEREKIKQSLDDGHRVILMGGEGHGKSWLAAQVCSEHEGIALFSSAEEFEHVSTSDLEKYLIDLLIRQTSDVPATSVKKRWSHRIRSWKAECPENSLLWVVDGINQRHGIHWHRILNTLSEFLHAIGGRLIVTVRPQFWHKIVAPGISFESKLFEVSEWQPSERDLLLKHHGINIEWLDGATLNTLKNPRLLSVAVATLPHCESEVWKGLTTDRILFEHLRASQRENFEEETIAALSGRLSTHAKRVLERVNASTSEPPRNFEADSDSVIETRFFRTLPGPGGAYELRNEGLTLALGYTLIDQLWQASRLNLALEDQVARLIDPIHAMDRTVDVLMASLMICSLDENRFSQSVFMALLDAFSSLQNVDEQRFEEFVEIVRKQPKELLDSLGVFTLESGRRLNEEWFVQAALLVISTEYGWQVSEPIIHSWFRSYNRDAVEQSNRFPRGNPEDDAKQLKERQQRIQETISSLSSFEQDLFDQMKEVKGETDSLFSLGLRFLAGKPLAGFANSFVAMGLGVSLDGDCWNAHRAFSQLTIFNRVDPEQAKMAFLAAIEPLRDSSVSRSGQWTVVRMLIATGDEKAAAEANAIAEKLRERLALWDSLEPEEWRGVSVADIDVLRPKDLEGGLTRFVSIDTDKMMQSRSVNAEDHRFKEILPVLCRFEPNIAVERAGFLISGLLVRTGTGLRQLIVNGQDYAPLITREMALKLVERVTASNMMKTLPENERDMLRMFVFKYVAPHLTPSEQLCCMTSADFGKGYLLDVIPSLKLQASKDVAAALELALDAGDFEAAYGVLIAVRFGKTVVTPWLEALIVRCYRCEVSKVRGLSCELAVLSDLALVRDVHVKSDWVASTDRNSGNETWFASILLIEACIKKEISLSEMLRRVTPESWFVAANRIDEALRKPLADYILRRLRGGVFALKGLSRPALDYTLSPVEHSSYTLRSVDEADLNESRFTPQDSFENLFREDDFDEKQKRLRTNSEAFFTQLSDSDARIFVERLTIEDVALLIHQEPSFLIQVVEILEEVSRSELAWLRNLALSAANLLSGDMPERAASLIHKAVESKGFVSYDLGDSLTLEHKAVWSCQPSTAIIQYWRRRILSCGNDESLAMEVLAAERFGAKGFIKDFVGELSDSTLPLDKAYAITIAGFSSQIDELVSVIDAHIDDVGITGVAAKKAKADHQAMTWATKWVSELCSAQTPEQFWRSLIILKTCLDARGAAEPLKDTEWAHYGPLYQRVRESSIKEINKARKKTLVGQEVPDPIFLAG